MTKQQMKEHTEEMINRVYADLPADVRNQMIAAENKSIDARFGRNSK